MFLASIRIFARLLGWRPLRHPVAPYGGVHYLNLAQPAPDSFVFQLCYIVWPTLSLGFDSGILYAKTA